MSFSSRIRSACLAIFVGVFGGGTLALAETAPTPKAEVKFDAAALEFFEKDVRPLLVKRCYECHGAQAEKPGGGLRLDSRAAALKGGDTQAAVVPGDIDPKKSLLIDTINYGELYQMPPKGKLPPEEIAILTKWVASGAPWPEEAVAGAGDAKTFDLAARKKAHWCWQPIADPQPPTVRDAGWSADPLDRFVLAKLEAASLRPAADADRRDLVRRAYYDLHGMLPPADVDPEFLRTGKPEDWARLIDELLASPRYGERWARHWLDLARFAETYGHEFDYPIHNPWRYRDYVIRAFNADLPYDRFAREQIAGDLEERPRIDPATGLNESLVGTGFWFFGELTHAPVDVRQHDADRIDNMVDVYSKTFLGLTIACARCHDHKFDAIATTDYYALTGILRGTREQHALLDPHEGQTRVAAEMQQHIDAARNATLDLWATVPPDQAVRLGTELKAVFELGPKPADNQIEETAARIKSEPDRLRRWIKALNDDESRDVNHPGWFARRAFEGKPVDDGELETLLKELENRPQGAAQDALIANSSPLPKFFSGAAFEYAAVRSGERWLTAPNDEGPLLPAEKFDTRRLHAKLRGTARSETFLIPKSGEIHFKVAGKNAGIRVVIDGYKMDDFNGLLFEGLKLRLDHAKPTWLKLAGAMRKYVGQRAYLEYIDDGDGWISIEDVRFDPPKPSRMTREPAELFLLQNERSSLRTATGWAERYQRVFNTVFSAAREKRLAGIRREMFLWVLRHDLVTLNDEQVRRLADDLKTHASELNKLAATLPAMQTAMAASEGNAWDDPVYIRGNHKTTGELVPRHFPTALCADAPQPFGPGSGRRELAAATVARDNPLFARVIVNRLWHHLYGRGISTSVDNFGVLGSEPTHPELLDRLATDFIDDGYSIKRMLRRLMLSRSYRMAAWSDPRSDEADPANALLHKQRLRRISGEALRDMLLQLSGSFKDQMYGPSVPVHLTPFMSGRGRPGEQGPLDGGGRRSIYQIVRRNFPAPLFAAFDTPTPFNTIGRRNESNVPAQALILMNDPFVRTECEKWAAKLLADEKSDDQERLRRMFRAAWNRPASEEELSAAREFLLAQGTAQGLPAERALKEKSVWADLAQTLINAKEFEFVP